MSLKSSHSLTDHKYVNLVSWFHTWANTCLLCSTQWLNSNILITFGPKILISFHSKLVRRLSCGTQPIENSARAFLKLYSAVRNVTGIFLSKVRSHRYWTKRLKFPPKCVGTFGRHSAWSHFRCYTWELWCNKDPKSKKAGLRKTLRHNNTSAI